MHHIHVRQAVEACVLLSEDNKQFVSPAVVQLCGNRTVQADACHKKGQGRVGKGGNA